MTTKNNINLHILNASGKLTPYVKKIQNIFDETIIKVLKKIPLFNVDVVIYESKEGTIPELGMVGQTYGPDLIFIYLDTKFSSFVDKTLEEELNRTITHELNHAARCRTIPYGGTLLNILIWEGLADHFDMEINNKGPQIWDVALKADQVKKMMEMAKREYGSKNYDHNGWLFGSKEKGIPRWAGYTIGYNLVAEYLEKNPSKKPSQLHNLKAEEFIK